MILINLLPPELRRTRHQADPVVYGLAAAMAASLLPVALWAWIHYSRIPAAQALLGSTTAELDVKAAEAKRVEDERAKIAEFIKHRDLIVGLLARKVYWARTIDDFANHLTGTWQGLGFEMSCTELQIAATTPLADVGKKKGDQIAYSFRGRFKIVGDVKEKAGDHINAFFDRTERSAFWRTHGFQEKPEKTYRGDTPEWREGIERETVEFTLDWIRQKDVITASAKAGK
jgi:hypothetical protein